jgi:hypothetical protein
VQQVASQTNPALHFLNLQNNHIDLDGLVVIAKSLLINTRLESLSLSGNVIGYNAAIALAVALRYNGALKTFD